MNDRPDYVTENWLRCLGLSGKAAKAVMDVHTDQLNAQRVRYVLPKDSKLTGVPS